MTQAIRESVSQRNERQMGERFTADTRDHKMTILHDDGLYRHIRLQKPGTNIYWYDLITWPGNLTITGDMGCFTIARIPDMLQFVAGDRINPHYWAEKVRGDRHPRSVTEDYSEAVFRETVLDHISDYEDEFTGLGAAVQTQIFTDLGGDICHEDLAREALNDFEYVDVTGGSVGIFRFTDTWEWTFRDYSQSWLWCCYAMQWGANAYRATKVSEATS